MGQRFGGSTGTIELFSQVQSQGMVVRRCFYGPEKASNKGIVHSRAAPRLKVSVCCLCWLKHPAGIARNDTRWNYTSQTRLFAERTQCLVGLDSLLYHQMDQREFLVFVNGLQRIFQGSRDI
ncbi:hypothetical protein D3C74_353920 [compost metagenome]